MPFTASLKKILSTGNKFRSSVQYFFQREGRGGHYKKAYHPSSRWPVFVFTQTLFCFFVFLL